MNKKILYTVLIIMLLLYLKIILTYDFNNNTIYKLNLLSLEDLTSITLEKDTINKTIDNEYEIKNIIDILSFKELTTTIQSISDTPVNASDKIKMDFNFKEDKTSTIVIYKRKNNYYIEQPYNGIYKISNEKYSMIEKILNN